MQLVVASRFLTFLIGTLLALGITTSPALAAKSIHLTPIGSFPSEVNPDVFDESAAEIVAYDPATQRLFVVNGFAATIDVLSISDPTQPIFLFAIDVTPYGKQANSVAVKNGIVAAAVENNNTQEPGAAVFFDTDGNFLNQVTVGALPDMLTFTPDGKRVLVANEGEPNDDYTVDPEGSVSIIDVSGGVENATVTTAGFEGFNDQKEELIESGVRIFGPNFDTPEPDDTASVAKDLEPEFIVVSNNSKTAWVTLQENNALAVVDINKAEVTDILPLGFKDHSLPGNDLDASNEDNRINIRNWPTHGMYQPDAIAAYKVGGTTFLITANEGDAREYEGDPGFVEEARVEDLTLDPVAFPNAAMLQLEENLGRLKVTTTLGDPDNDGVFEELFSFGARSFSIWTTDGGLVFDSGDAIEQLTAALLPAGFNSTDNENDSFDDRSDDKGPEPEGVATGKVDGIPYAFIGLERIGGIMVFDVSDPHRPVFAQYINTRDFSGDPEQGTAGDLAPEGLIFIEKGDSPNGKPLLVVAYEVSGTTTIFEIEPVDVIPGTFPISSSTKLEVDKDVRMNGQSVSKGKQDGASVVTIDGARLNLSQELPELNPPSFPPNDSKVKIKVDEDTLFTSTTAVFYKEVEIKKDQSATFSGGGPFHIDTLKVKKNAELNLGAGTYFINKLEMKDDNASINIISEPVTLNIGDKAELDAKELVLNGEGVVEGFQVYLYDDAEFKAKKEGLNFTGLIYGPRCKKVELEKATIRGAVIVNGEVKLKKEIDATYTEVDQALVGTIAP